MTQIATWQLPSDKSADSSNTMFDRMFHYRFELKHYLNDGTRVVPNIKTMKHILQAHDEFGLEVAISTNSYTVVKDNSKNA